MYIPKINRFGHDPEIYAFIRQHPFAIVVNMLDGKPWATHIPVELEENAEGEYVLRTHISKANPQWKAFESSPDAMVIFHGAHAYISASWYDHENVSTWNYQAVHVYGKVKVLEGDAVRQLLDRLVKRHESREKHPIYFNDLSDEFLNAELKGIVAFEISIEAIHAMNKLSQNRNRKNYMAVIENLEERKDPNSTIIAKQMTDAIDTLFNPET